MSICDREQLENEYFHLYSVVENFDSKSLTIKAWSVTLCVGIAGSGAFTDHYDLLIYAAVASFLFWLIETYWKTFQYAHYRRLGQIEAYLSGDQPQIDCLQIGRSWYTSYKDGGGKRFLRIMFRLPVLLPHGNMAVGFALWYLLTILFR